MLTVLRSRDFALLWVGQLISVVGDWVLFIGLPFAVYERTGSAAATGALFVVETLPRVSLGSVTGVLVDRWDRRRTMVAADLLRALALLPLLAVGDDGWLWLVYPVAFVQATLSQLFLPARSAIVPRLVGERDLAAANGLVGLGDELAFTVGSAVGGALLAVVSLSALVVVDVATYLASALCILLVSAPMGRIDAATDPTPPVGAPWRALWADLRSGLELVRRQRLVRAVFAVTGLAMVGEGIVAVLMVVFVEDLLGEGAREFGWLAAARGIGGILGGVVVGLLATRLAPRRLIAAAGVLDGLALLLLFNSSAMPLLLAIAALAGVGVVIFYVAQQTILQQRVADAYLGRVFGSYEAMQGLLLLLGMGLAAGLTGPLGARWLLDAAGVLFLVAGAVAAWLLAGDGTPATGEGAQV